MMKIIAASLLGGAITASILGAGAANAAPNEYADKTPQQLVQISLERSASLPAGQLKALVAADKEFRKGTVAGDTAAKAILVDVVDGPQWAADPALEALSRVLPRNLGGGTNGDSYTNTPGGTGGLGRNEADGSIQEFRNSTLLEARNKARAQATANLDKAAKVRDQIRAAVKPATK
jgi:hypothetical protein